MEWTKQDSKLANLEGWDLYECFCSSDGDWQVQANDDANSKWDAKLKDDTEAWELVANGNKEHHKKVLAFLKEHNPSEYDRIIDKRN